ncbi:MAG: prepilin peptidase [Rhodobacteraceae bacterium]|nr:prepilin peptidase [Paracoccaceae bacterium]
MIRQEILPFAIFLIAISPAIGSFLSVVVDRIPKRQSVIHPRSRCASCNTILSLTDLIPILSFLWRRGRCRSCNTAIPAWILYIEIVATGTAVLAALVAQTPEQLVLLSLYLWCLTALAFCDLTRFRLPDVLTLLLLVLGLLLAVENPQTRLVDAFLAALVGSTVFLLIRIGYQTLRKKEGLGLGDVKLMAGVGAGVGLLNLPYVVLIGALTAIAGALFVILRGHSTQQNDLKIPFGTHLCIATGLVLLATL